jgi:hypothetical protein
MAPHYKAFPWITEGRVELIHLYIKDMGIREPEWKLDAFRNLVDYLCNQLQAGKRIHIGCIGGHGRSGLLLSAIVAKLGTKDAIQWVRQNHCEKAVESEQQINFLVKHYGVTPAEPAKKEWSTVSQGCSYSSTWSASGTTVKVTSASSSCDRSFVPAPSKKTIWN